MTGTSPADPRQSGQDARRPSTVIVPALAATLIGLWLGTLGYSMVGFGIATSCTDVHESIHGCDAMYRWMDAGRNVQWVLLLPVIAALAAGLACPANRHVIAVSTWALTGLSVGWFAFYMYKASSTF